MQWLAEICIKRPVFATMIVMALVVVGSFAFFSLGTDRFPSVDFPTVTVTTTNPGSAPTEIETEITDRLEEEINTISGIEDLRSTSVDGVSQVIVTFDLSKDADVATQEVRDKVNLVINDLPETAEQPVVQKLETDAAPILQIIVAAPRSLREVYDIADKQIADRIESVAGVGQVRVVGGTEREIKVSVNPERMRAYNITATDVTNAVRRQNLELPGGRVDAGAREIAVRTIGRLPSAEDFNNLVIGKRGNYSVKLRDIGEAKDGSEEQRTVASLNGQPAIGLIVSKQSGENTVAVADAVKERLAEVQKDLPADLRVQIVSDQTTFIEASLDSIYEHLIVGGILAVVVVFVFLWNIRSTFIAAIAIPTSIVAAFGFMYAMNYTLNQITMLALTLMVGIVIDDAIVVLENIYRFIEEKGMNPFEAAIEGTREIGLAVLATTLSLLAVFVPVGFMGGIAGRFMSSFGLTAAAAIAVSLIVSFSLTPMLSARLLKANETGGKSKDEEIPLLKYETPEIQNSSIALNEDIAATTAENSTAEVVPNPKSKIQNPKGEGAKNSFVYRKIDGAYTWLLKLSMVHRWIIVGLCALVIFSIYPLFTFVGKNFLPNDDESQFQVLIRTPEGTSLAATQTIVERVARDIKRDVPGVADTLAVTGGSDQQLVNDGSIFIRLELISSRENTQLELMTKVREMLPNYPQEWRMSVQNVSAVGGGGSNAEIQYVLTGPDLTKLAEYSKQLLARMKTIPDAVDADSTLYEGRPEMRIEVDRTRAADLGVEVGDVADAINILVAGQDVSTFNGVDDQYDVNVRAVGDARLNEANLKQLTVRSSTVAAVTLDRVVKISEATGPAAIDRLNRGRQITLRANVRPGGSSANVTAQMDAFVREMNFEPGYGTALSGSSDELGKTAYYFAIAISLSFIFMYMVLAAQFESFIHPITILLTLPLAVPFGILSLLIMGETVNIFSGLGLLVLFGVVKKNAILQVDHTNTLRREGLERYEAIIQANRDRLRPILMTTIALVAGMLPLIFSSGAGAGTNRNIGVLIVGGQSLCLLLTLLAVPVFYSLFDDLATSPLWTGIGDRYRKISNVVGRRTAGAWSGIAAIFTRKKDLPADEAAD